MYGVGCGQVMITTFYLVPFYITVEGESQIENVVIQILGRDTEKSLLYAYMSCVLIRK